MPRVLQLVHGHPPRENAGTEQYTHRLSQGLGSRGWSVQTLAASPEPGRPMYSVTQHGGLIRVVNNAPYAGLRNHASDPTFDRLVERLAADVDVVHVQHLTFLSCTFRVRAPIVWTLHDAWAWCAAGGLLLRRGAPCDGPSPACASCASSWAGDTRAVTTALAAAGKVGRFVSPARLHAAWQIVPAKLRARVTGGTAPPLSADVLAARRANILAFARRCARIVSPSRWLAEAARAQGVPVTDVIPHGFDLPPAGHLDLGAGGAPPATPPAPRPIPSSPRPFVFLGTLAAHKGPHLVAAAWHRSGVANPLRIHGPAGPDAAYVAGIPHHGPLGPMEALRVLRGAQALVLGSTWPENAPLVILEARAVGCPVIAPSIGGIPELVTEGVDGWLYPPGDVGALASRLRDAADSACPPVRPAPSFSAHLDAIEALYGAVGAPPALRRDPGRPARVGV